MIPKFRDHFVGLRRRACFPRCRAAAGRPKGKCSTTCKTYKPSTFFFHRRYCTRSKSRCHLARIHRSCYQRCRIPRHKTRKLGSLRYSPQNCHRRCRIRKSMPSLSRRRHEFKRLRRRHHGQCMAACPIRRWRRCRPKCAARTRRWSVEARGYRRTCRGQGRCGYVRKPTPWSKSVDIQARCEMTCLSKHGKKTCQHRCNHKEVRRNCASTCIRRSGSKGVPPKCTRKCIGTEAQWTCYRTCRDMKKGHQSGCQSACYGTHLSRRCLRTCIKVQGKNKHDCKRKCYNYDVQGSCFGKCLMNEPKEACRRKCKITDAHERCYRKCRTVKDKKACEGKCGMHKASESSVTPCYTDCIATDKAPNPAEACLKDCSHAWIRNWTKDKCYGRCRVMKRAKKCKKVCHKDFHAMIKRRICFHGCRSAPARSEDKHQCRKKCFVSSMK